MKDAMFFQYVFHIIKIIGSFHIWIYLDIFYSRCYLHDCIHETHDISKKKKVRTYYPTFVSSWVLENKKLHKMKSFESSYRNLNRTLLSTVTLLAIDEQSSPVKCQSDVTVKSVYTWCYTLRKNVTIQHSVGTSSYWAVLDLVVISHPTIKLKVKRWTTDLRIHNIYRYTYF